jgi:hypothetical protein
MGSQYWRASRLNVPYRRRSSWTGSEFISKAMGRRYYNEARPHTALDWMTPSKFARGKQNGPCAAAQTEPEILLRSGTKTGAASESSILIRVIHFAPLPPGSLPFLPLFW